MSSLSVLICTYNRHQMLQQALQALVFRTTEKPDQVVVVNGGDEQANRVVEQFTNNPFGVQVKSVKTVNKNLATSRNVGLPHCTGDIIAMTDDDAEVYPDWVNLMKTIHVTHPEAGAVGGAVIGAASQDSLLSRVADVFTFPSPTAPCYVRTLPGVNISYKREVLNQLGSQDETLFRGEDVDYNWRVKRLGYEVYYDPSIRVLHHHRLTLKKFLQQNYMYGRAYYLVRRKWRDMYCVYPHRFASLKDILKGGYFVAAVAIEPFLLARKMTTWPDRIAVVPILVANQFAWKGGMIVQMIKDRAAQTT